MKSGAASLAAAFAGKAFADTLKPIAIIDTHIHLYDPSRSEGVPWPPKTDSILYKPAMPDRYKTVTHGLGIRGAIAIECSPWESDNDWLLKTASQDPIIVGVIGDLVPGSSSFRKTLDRISANPLFRGIRYGNLWDRNLLVDMSKPGFVEDLKALSQAQLVLDSANPNADLISALVRIKDRIPELTIVVDHLPNAQIPSETVAQKEYSANLERLRDSPRVFVKLSEVPTRVNDEVQVDSGFYKQKLDTLWDLFGENRVLFGSDWPNSDHLANYLQTLELIQKYVEAKGRNGEEKFFWRNSISAYNWRPRLMTQRLTG